MADFTIETRKHIADYGWTNTWHVRCDTFAKAEEAAEIIGTFESNLLYAGVEVDSAKVSTWPNPGGQDFVIVPLGLNGAVSMDDPEPAEMCMLVKIEATLGHQGKKWLRFSLDEDDVQASGKQAVITGGAGVLTRFAAAAGALTADLDTAEVTLLIGSDQTTARTSTNEINLAGVGIRDADVGWYNHQA